MGIVPTMIIMVAGGFISMRIHETYNRIDEIEERISDLENK